jgi:ribosomal protein L24
VIVTSGKDRGKKGTVKKCLRSVNRVVVEGINLVIIQKQMKK